MQQDDECRFCQSSDLLGEDTVMTVRLPVFRASPDKRPADLTASSAVSWMSDRDHDLIPFVFGPPH
jgi:hypothetical protein